MDARFDVELVAVTKRFGTNHRGKPRVAAHSQGQLLLPVGAERLRQDHDTAHDRRAMRRSAKATS